MFLKNFQNSKIPKTFPICPKIETFSVPKVVSKRKIVLPKHVLGNMFWGNFFEKLFCPVFHGGSSLRNVFYKFKKFSKFQKRPKSFPNCPKVFWTCFGVIFSRNFFCPVFHVGSSLRNVSEKFSKFKKRPKPFPICPNVFWTCFGVILSKNFFAQCSMEGRVFEMFLKSFQNSKNAQNRSQKFENCFERVLG